MEGKESWDWTTQSKEIPISEWKSQYNWVQTPCVSLDGERVASIVNVDEMAFGICENGELWEEEFEKAWSLQKLADKGFAACVSQDEEWTVCVNGALWESRFDFIWNLECSSDGSHIGVACQQDMEYGMAVDDQPWETLYESLTGMIMGQTGDTAGVAQMESMAAADVDAFRKGLFSVIRNGEAFDTQYLNAWDINFDSEGKRLAWAVRFDRETYGVAVDDELWEGRFQMAWKPVFLRGGSSVLAPVRQGGKWYLFQDNKKFWNKGYGQLWHIVQSPSSDKVAAIVSPDFGKWSVAVDDQVWSVQADAMISEIHFSQDGSSLAAVAKDKGLWNLFVNGKAWNLGADKLFSPCLSQDGSVVAVTLEKKGKWFVAVNDSVRTGPYEMMDDPVISPDGSKILIKGVENGIYKRQVISL